MYVNESPSDLALERADYNWPYLQTNNSAIEQDNDSEERQRASTPADSVRYYPTRKNFFIRIFSFLLMANFNSVIYSNITKQLIAYIHVIEIQQSTFANVEFCKICHSEPGC